MAKRSFRSNREIKNALIRAKILAARGAPIHLKLAFLGLTRRGGVPLRVNKFLRKLPAQLRGVNARETIRERKF